MFAHSRRTLQSAGSSRQATRRPPVSRTADDEASLELPAYQEPSCQLNEDGKRELRELAGSRLNAKLQKHTEESAKLLANTVFAINERVTNRKDAVNKVVKKRRVNNDGQGATDDDELEALKARAEELEDTVSPLTLKVEKAMREVLDLQAALQDEKDVLRDLHDAVVMAQCEEMQQARDNATDEDDEEIHMTGVSIYRILEQGRETKTKAYNDVGMLHKYAKNNAYIDFKRNWHDGLYPNDEIPVPDPKTWFDRNGQPQHLTGAGGGGEDESDDDIQISREKRSFRCPLSLVALTNPYTCRRCKHSFQKEAIYDYLQITGPNSRGIEKGCPESGCDIKVSQSPRTPHMTVPC